MSLFIWDDSLSVGIESIDKQHMKLVEMLNDFYKSIKNNSTKEVLSELIRKMREYIIYHFKSEEEILKRNGYPDFIEHQKEHEIFINKVKEFEERYESGKLILSIEITNFLKSWLKTHIQGTDKRYSKFLIAKGVK